MFAVNGDIVVRGHRGVHIKGLRLRQLSPAEDRKTLHFADCESIRIDQLRIDLGEASNIGRMNESGGLWIDGGSNHDIRNVEAFGHGKNSLIAIWNTRQSSYSNLRVRDAQYDNSQATDDMLQGIRLLGNSDCVVRSPIVSNLTGNANGRFPNRFTRGIVLGKNVRVAIVEAQVSNMDQGIDVTGSDGNEDCTILRAHCFECNAVGIKLANSAVRCRVVDSIAERCGLMGFLASGPSEPGLRNKTQDCDFIRCTAIDPGYNGFSDSGPHAGFRVERNRFDPEYPMGIRCVDCRAIDNQAVKTMLYGYYAHVQKSSEGKRNQLINCTSQGQIRAVSEGGWS